jgi:L-malate glycosyltransferase
MQQNRIKLLKFVANFGIGGTERQVVNLVRALDPFRFELHLACLRRWGELLDELQSGRAPAAEYKISRLYNHTALAQQFRFARNIRHHRIQIVHTYGFYPNVFAIPTARMAGVPVIVASIRDTGIYLTPIQKRVQKMICRLADCILVNAEAVRQWLITEGYPRERIFVIRNGVDLSRFTGKHNGNPIRAELGLPPRAPLVAVLSRIYQMKGMEYFLESAAIVARRVPEARFLIVGSAFTMKEGKAIEDLALRRELEDRAVRLGLNGKVIFTGFRLDVPEVLSEVSVSVLPSLSEGLSNSLLEAMATGIPVVATRVGGNPEVVEEGVTGLLVPPRDPGALADAIYCILEKRELASRFGQAGRQRVVERFSLERMVRETERLYLSLLQSGSRNRERGYAQDLA